MSLVDRLAGWAGLDSLWERPGPTPVQQRSDVVVAVALAVDTALFLELMRCYADFRQSAPLWAEYLAIATLAVPLAVRRRFPLVVALYAALHMVVVGVWVTEVQLQIPMQIAYFLAFFTALAWGRDRRMAVVTMGAVTLLVLAWLAVSVAVGSGIDELLSHQKAAGYVPHGLLPPVVAYTLVELLANVLYLAGAGAWGFFAWHAAHNRVILSDQQTRLANQAAELRDQAVVDERLRIARELHDVVAHHVSVMGVQAGAARRVLAKDPARAAQALSAVESSSRQAVSEMRGLLGTLRHSDPQTDAESRAPQPTLVELPALVDSYRSPGFEPAFSLVEDEPGAARAVPAPVALTLVRTAQEALTNTRKHSTARSATVTVRVARTHAEIEVVDDGRPVGGTSGTGLGLLGMRERIAAAKGVVDVGPRIYGGYRVRVRLPLGSTS